MSNNLFRFARLTLTAFFVLVLGHISIPVVEASCNSDSLTPGTTNRNMAFDGRTRSYILRVPQNYTGTTPVPLIVDLHGFTSNPSSQANVSGWREKSEEIGAIIAWPAGVDDSWNGYGCCGTALSQNIDDVGFMKALVAEIAGLGNVDLSRVYATGLSNGGSMSHRLACEAADVFAATTPVSFPLNRPASQCNPVRPISVIHFHGLNDTTVPYNGGGSLDFQSAPDSFSAWRQVDGCTNDTSTEPFGGSNRCESATTCSDGVTPTLCSVEAGHVPYSNGAIDIPDYAWSVMSQYQLDLPPDSCDGEEPPPPPPGECVAGDTDWLNPSAEWPDFRVGDGDGFESSPTAAFADGGGAAENTNGTGDRHRFFNYNIAIPEGCAVKGIEVRLDWWLSSTFGSNSMSAALTSSGATLEAIWTADKTDSQETTSQHTAILGSSSDTWGRSWTAEDLGNDSFRVRVTTDSSSSFRDFFLDWIPVRVTYGP